MQSERDGLNGKRATGFRAVQVVRQRTIVSRQSISHIARASSAGQARTNELRDAGILTVTHRGLGKKGDSVSLSGDLGYVIGIDVQQAAIAVAVANAAFAPIGIEPRTRHRLDVERDADGVLDAVAELVEEVVEMARSSHDSSGKPYNPDRLIGVGLGLPGPINRISGRVSAATSVLPGWWDITPVDALRIRLGGRLEDIPRIVIENDANLGALGVYTMDVLTADDPEEVPADILYVRAGDGIGAGILLKRKLVGGGSGYAGEIGHIKVDDHGPLCPRCGQRGCVETKAAGPYIVSQIRGMHRNILSFPKGTTVDEQLTAIVSSNHPACGRALWGAGWYLGLAMGHACTLLDPSRVYVGGRMSDSVDFMNALKHATGQSAIPTAGGEQRASPRGGAFSELPDDFIVSIPAAFAKRRLSPELVGGFAIAMHRCGDDFLRPRVIESISA